VIHYMICPTECGNQVTHTVIDHTRIHARAVARV
jgi:hypothetical protein